MKHYIYSILMFIPTLSCTKNKIDCKSCQKSQLSLIPKLARFEGEDIFNLNQRLEAEIVAVDWPQLCYTEKEDRPIAQVVLHNTVVNLTETMDIFKNCKFKGKVSIHYIVDKSGKIHKALDEKHIAHHAKSANKLSIGIEIVADKPNSIMPEVQENAVVELTKDIMTRHGLEIPKRVLQVQEDDPNYGLIEIYSPLTTHRVVINGTTDGAHSDARQGTLCPSYIWPKRENFLDWRRKNFSDFEKKFRLQPLSF